MKHITMYTSGIAAVFLLLFFSVDTASAYGYAATPSIYPTRYSNPVIRPIVQKNRSARRATKTRTVGYKKTTCPYAKTAYYNSGHHYEGYDTNKRNSMLSHPTYKQKQEYYTTGYYDTYSRYHGSAGGQIPLRTYSSIRGYYPHGYNMQYRTYGNNRPVYNSFSY